MFKKSIYILGCSLFSPLMALPMPSDLTLNQAPSENIVVNNRILLKIKGKTISLWDVVKKMDLLFYKQYPEFADSNAARYQFYMGSWRPILDAVIDDYLIMADAEEKKIQVNDGEVREELERLFGPDVVLNLDKLGMTLEEAFDLLRTELTVQRMSSVMVRSKALSFVSPLIVKKQYQEFVKKNPPYTCWVYQILSIRGPDHERLAQLAHQLIVEQNIALSKVSSVMDAEGAEISLSEEFCQKDANLSSAYKAVLQGLAAGTVSSPVSNQKLSRLFCLKEIQEVASPPFKDVEDQLKLELTQQAFERFGVEYRQKLRKHYGLTEQYLNHLVPSDIHPFEMR